MIPVCEPTIGEAELRNVTECLQTNWISSQGRFIREFEERFSSYLGVKYGVATTSGTTAIHLALASVGIKEGDEVIMPTFTMIASALPVVYTGATPVVVDAEPETWNMDVNQIEAKITKGTRAIMPVHIYGHPCDMAAIADIALRHGLLVIEDAAEAHGGEYKGRKAGSLSDVACFSFYANKIVTTGEGGMVVTDRKEIYEQASLLKNLAHARERRFLHYQVGFNYRMTNIQAAIGLAQMERIDELVEARRRNAQLYNTLLKDIGGVTLPPEESWAKNVYWMYSVLINEAEFGMGSEELARKLYEKGIETRPFFIPLHQQPVFRQMGLFVNEHCPVAERLSVEGINLPSSSSLKASQIEYICQEIKKLAR